MRNRRGKNRFILIVGAFCISFLLWSSIASAITVNSVGDESDHNLSNTNCDVDGDDNAPHVCTLRAAIETANSNPDTTIITFNITGQPNNLAIISPGSPLPTIIHPIEIYGSTQTGYQTNTLPIDQGTNAVLRIEIKGTHIGGNGLTLDNHSNSVINTVIINSFSRGIVILGGGSHSIRGNFIGTESGGQYALPNTTDGIYIENSANNHIGGPENWMRNLISGNSISGVRIHGTSATNNKIQNNLIGTLPNGMGGLGNGEDGILITESPNNIIESNVISHNNESGVDIEVSTASGQLIQHNYIGLTANGEESLGNGDDGIQIENSPNHAILGNVISSNVSNGIQMEGASATQITIRGNKIGTDKDGEAALGNNDKGIHLLDAPENIIGGSQPGEGNLISANYNQGIHLEGGGSFDNVIQGNRIGTHLNGEQGIGNEDEGIWIQEAPNNTVGGTQPGAGNLISGNGARGLLIEGNGASGTGVWGNLIGTNENGTTALGNHTHGIEISNAPSSQVGGTEAGAGNLVSGNQQDGILLQGESVINTVIQGNTIGANVHQDQAIGNGGNGVHFFRFLGENQGPSFNTIGGSESAARNLISGNQQNGIQIEGKGTSNNKIQGNFIGTDGTGVQAIGNQQNGIRVTTGEQPDPNIAKSGPPFNNIIGGIEAVSPEGPCNGACNLVSGNQQDGIRIDGVGVTLHQVQANFVGTDVQGTTAIPNGSAGIRIAGAHNNTIGGFPGDPNAANPRCNLISGNQDFGVVIFGGLAKLNQVYGNLIGTDITGTQALSNSGGILLQYTSGNQVGSSTTQSGNTIAGNLGPGIEINESHNTMVQGNRIGLQKNGMEALANEDHGIHIKNLSTANTIGGEVPGQGNHIAHNKGDGIFIESLRNNEIITNSIHDNEAMGIDLAPLGVTLNDEMDEDEGANLLQNYPEITTVHPLTIDIEVNGTLQGTPNNEYKIQIYSNEECDASENGEGKYYLGLDIVTTDSAGQAQFSIVVPKLGGEMITATATDVSKNTSEFSPCQKLTPKPTIIPDVDLDKAPDETDNCPNDPNPDQLDSDQDGTGDACDICPDYNDRQDLDENGIPDCLELLVRGAGEHGCALDKNRLSATSSKLLVLGLGLIILSYYLLRRKKVPSPLAGEG